VEEALIPTFDTTTTTLARGLNFALITKYLLTEDIVCGVEASIWH
jgi:hypothetical protein